MKSLRTQIILALALAGVSGAFAQTNNAVPGATDYAAFSRFVTDRNIFDPNRQPHYASSRPRSVARPRTHSTSAPAFTFVGTINYQKGLFAFFSGNSDEFKKVLPATGKIAGYTVTEIAPGGVTLAATNQAEPLKLKVGDGLREENGKWELSGASDAGAGDRASASAAVNASGAVNSAPAPSPALGQNDILKRLMEKRAKESP